MALFHKSKKPKTYNARCHKATPAEVKRHKIVALLDFGIKPADICRKMAYSPDLVKKVDKLRRAGKSLAANPKGKPLHNDKIATIYAEAHDALRAVDDVQRAGHV